MQCMCASWGPLVSFPAGQIDRIGLRAALACLARPCAPSESERSFVSWTAMRSALARPGRREALGVVHLLEEIPAPARGEPFQIEENARGHDRAGPASAGPHLVDAGDQANATSAVVGKEGKSLTELRLSTTPPKIRTPPKLVPPAGCELPLLDAQALRELGLVAPDLLDEALGVLSAHARLERVTEGKRRRQRVVDDRVPESRSTLAARRFAVGTARRDTRGARDHASA